MPSGKPHDSRPKCGARKKNGQGHCQQPAMANGRCRLHGGKTPSGVASANFKTGRYSKDLPTRMVSRYEEAGGDRQRLALDDEIALIEARIADVIGRADTGESGAIWRALRDTWRTLTDARRINDTAGVAGAINEIGRLIARGAGDHAAWAEVTRLVEQRRRLAETERKRLIDMRQMVTTDQALAFARAVMHLVNEHVHDRTAIAAIQAGLVVLADVPDRG